MFPRPCGLEDYSNWSEKNFFFGPFFTRSIHVDFPKDEIFVVPTFISWKSLKKVMVSTCVLNFRCIIGVEYFQKILVLKEGPEHCQYIFNFLINTILFILNFTTIVI